MVKIGAHLRKLLRN